MASLFSSSTTTPTTKTTTGLSSISPNPLYSKPSQLLAFRSSQTCHVAPKISCNVAKNDDHRQQTPKTTTNKNVETNKFDRRNMLLGLGGFYGVATTLSGGPATLAQPAAPDLTQCGLSELQDGSILDCCPPNKSSSQFVDFKLPKINFKIRPAAHLVDEKYIEKYSKALKRMKALPDSDPRSFKNQANVHCAYCNGGYEQVGLPNLELQIHESWLFFPFHRAYLYFYEKILGKLIDDPTFAIPYWNWDHPDGMVMPAMFSSPYFPFFDSNRNLKHLPPTIANLTNDGPDQEDNMSCDEQIKQNLAIMYKEMVSNAKTPSMFLGDPYRAGDGPRPGIGSLERQPHGTVHVWVGNPNNPSGEDMGTFYSAGRDPIFYAHHANVDRAWSIWKTLSPRNKDFNEKDFLNSYFYFYDENAKLVRIFVRDCLDSRKMGYDYQYMDIPWIMSRPTRHGRGHGHGHRHGALFSNVRDAKAADLTAGATASLTFPKPLDHIIRMNLPRPVTSRSKEEKEVEEEALIIKVESRGDVYSKFDVYVNDEDEVPTKENRTQTEYAGSFVNVPHKHKHAGASDNNNLKTTTVKFGLTDLIDDLGADDDDGIDVIFVPRTGTESVVIKDVRIQFLA